MSPHRHPTLSISTRGLGAELEELLDSLELLEFEDELDDKVLTDEAELAEEVGGIGLISGFRLLREFSLMTDP